jgi:hypothetical protein
VRTDKVYQRRNLEGAVAGLTAVRESTVVPHHQQKQPAQRRDKEPDPRQQNPRRDCGDDIQTDQAQRPRPIFSGYRSIWVQRTLLTPILLAPSPRFK